MDTIRFILFVSLAMVGMLLWQNWQRDYGPAPAPTATPESAKPAAEIAVAAGEVPAVPDHAARAIESAPDGPNTAESVIAVTDVFRVEFDARGAGVRRVELPRFPVSLDTPDVPFVLLDGAGPDQYVVQGGLLSRQAAPTHEASFRSPQREYVMDPARQSLVVPFVWQESGIEVTKRFTFERGSYLVSVSYEVRNTSAEAWRGQAYSQIKRAIPAGGGPKLIYTYTGPVLSSPENRYEKIKFDDLGDQAEERSTAQGWAAMLQHYFLAAVIPADPGATYTYRLRRATAGTSAIALLDAISPATEVAPGGTAIFETRLYMGPKLQHLLEQIAEGLDLTVDYGALWFIAKPLYWCLEWLHGLFGNWGWAIVFVTVLLKLAFFKLAAAGYRSMANMRRVQPRIVALRDRYKDDRARLNQAMMQIYKEEKINPFGGCLPILIQIPVFIALYWVLLESVEMRQAPFVMWIRDLSAPDPYWILPLIMGVTMFIQQKLNPAPMDPVQEKVMQIMPFAFTIFFGFFPSGLVLYWVANNILSIAQQWLITRNIERGAKAPG